MTSTEPASMGKEMGKRGTMTDGKPALLYHPRKTEPGGKCAFDTVTKDSTEVGLIRGLKRGPYDQSAKLPPHAGLLCLSTLKWSSPKGLSLR